MAGGSLGRLAGLGSEAVELRFARTTRSLLKTLAPPGDSLGL